MSHVHILEQACGILRTAKYQLVWRDFSGCLDSCVKGLEVLSSSVQADEAKSKQMQVSLGVIAVQALAELNQWQKVLQFLRDWFGEVKHISPQLLLLCISLYLRVGDLSTAEHLVSEWINEESNYDNTSYWSVVDLYVSKILLPVGGSEKVEDFVAKSCIISSERKQMYLKHVQSLKQKANTVPEVYTMESSCLANGIARRGADTKALAKTEDKGQVLQRIIRTLQWLKSVFHHSMTHQPIKQFVRAALLLFFLYALLLKTHSPGLLTGGSGAAVLWQGVVQSWKALFAPYHLMPTGSLAVGQS